MADAIEQLGQLSQLEFNKGTLAEALTYSDEIYAGLINNQFVMVGGFIYGSMLGRDYVWGLQTTHAHKWPVRFIRETRRFLDNRNRVLYCYSRYDSRWLELIGFYKVGERDALVEFEYGGRN